MTRFQVSGLKRIRLKYTLFSIILSILVGGVIQAINIGVGSTHFSVAEVLLIGAPLIILGLAWKRYPLIDFKVFLKKISLVTCLSVILWGVYLGWTTGADHYFPGNPVVNSIGMIAVIFVLLLPALDKLVSIIWDAVLGNELARFREAASDISHNLSNTLAYHEVLRIVTEDAAPKLGILNSSIWTYKSARTLVCVARTGGVDWQKPLTVPIKEFKKDLQSNQYFDINHIQFTHRKVRNPSQKQTLKRLEGWMAENEMTLAFPISLGGPYQGIWTVGHRSNFDPYSSDEIKLLKSMAQQISQTFLNAQHYLKLNEHFQDLSILNQFEENVHKSFSLTSIVSSIEKLLSTRYSCKNLIVYLPSADSPNLIPYGANTEKTNELPELGPDDQAILRDSKEALPRSRTLNKIRKKLSIGTKRTQEIFLELNLNQESRTGFICMAISKTAYSRLIKDPIFPSILQTAGTSIENALLYHQVLTMQEFQEQAVDNLSSGVVTLNTDKNITNLNKGIEEIFHVKKEKLLGQKVEKLPILKSYIANIENMANPSVSQVFETDVEIDSEKIPIVLSLNRLRPTRSEGQGYIAVVQDLRPVRRLQNKVAHSDRLSSIGQMAAGIAHEIKNPLTSLRLMSDMLTINWESSDFRAKYLQTMPQQLQRINNFCQSLLDLGKPRTLQFSDVSIKQLIQELLSLLEYELKSSRIHIIRQVPEDAFINADQGQISQVYLNIFLNAIQSIDRKKGGRLLFIVENFNEDFVKCTLEDTGAGISKTVLPNIFDPFFTTKEDGTGLGLPIAYRILQAHKGYIYIHSEDGKGTKVTIYLPRKDANRDHVHDPGISRQFPESKGKIAPNR